MLNQQFIYVGKDYLLWDAYIMLRVHNIHARWERAGSLPSTVTLIYDEAPAAIVDATL
jgi:hypothetical protein